MHDPKNEAKCYVDVLALTSSLSFLEIYGSLPQFLLPLDSHREAAPFCWSGVSLTIPKLLQYNKKTTFIMGEQKKRLHAEQRQCFI